MASKVYGNYIDPDCKSLDSAQVASEVTYEYFHDEKSPTYSDGPTIGFPTTSAIFNLKSSRYSRPFRSRIVECQDRPIHVKKDLTPSERTSLWIPRLGFIAGLLILFGYTYTGWTAWETNKYCLIMEDNFQTFNESIWTREIEVGGFGTGEFEWTTSDPENCYVEDGKLYLVPTIQDWPQDNDMVLNVTDICTADPGYSGRSFASSCVAMRNETAGTYIPPIQSARINTRNSYSVKYGRIEVVAKMPVGDWIWPAIWMMPVNNTYGIWPQSGEIDIAESRGNGVDFVSVNALGGTSGGGHNTIVSTLHWGPVTPFTLDSSGLTTNGLTFPSGSTSLTNDFHTFGIEWTAKSMRTYVDKKLTRVAYFKFPKKGFWSFGKYTTISEGQGYSFTNPWVDASSHAPFDQEFYLIMNLAVGGLGYFNTIDGLLPWNVGEGRDVAIEEFMDAKDSWSATWGRPSERGLVVKNVKMWEICN